MIFLSKNYYLHLTFSYFFFLEISELNSYCSGNFHQKHLGLDLGISEDLEVDFDVTTRRSRRRKLHQSPPQVIDIGFPKVKKSLWLKFGAAVTSDITVHTCMEFLINHQGIIRDACRNFLHFHSSPENKQQHWEIR